MRIVKAPYEPKTEKRIFLAGSIEQGNAVDWQQQVADLLEGHTNVVLLNPRRDDWDSSWVQSIENEQFRGQVEWELDQLDSADVILMYFDPATMSPISLLELGLYASSRKLRVVCPEGFWRKGNVEIVCARYGIPMFDSIEDAMMAVVTPEETE